MGRVRVGVTDEVEQQGSHGATDHSDPNETARRSPDSESTDPDASPEEPPHFEDLSLPQRVFVAAVQNPTRGVVIVGLFAFAFSFYVAFWMVFPRVAAFMSLLGLGLVGIMTLVYVLSNRW